MVIYIEKVLILNVIIHLLLIFITSYITSNKMKKINIIISTILGTINMFFYLTNPFIYNNIIKYSIILFISFIPFLNIKSTLLYLMLNFILGGITGVVNLSIKYYYEVIILCCISILFIIYFLKDKNNNEIKVIIKTDKEYIFNAFLDTGCFINLGLTPVIILSNKYNIDLKLFSTININTINGDTHHDVYKANNIYIYKNNKKIEKHCLIIKSNIDYDVIVGKNFLGGF